MKRGNSVELVKCPCCGEEYSPSYRKCPFCEEEEAPKRVKNKMRSGRRVTDKKKTHSGRGALIVILLFVLALLTWYLFGEKLMARFAQTEEPEPPVEDVTPPEGEGSDDPFYDPTIGDTEPNAAVPPAVDPAPGTDPNVDVSNAQLSKIDFTANAGESVQLSVTGTAAVPVWASKDTAVATVDSNGLVTAAGAGTTLITATVGDRTLECIVRVKGTGTNPGTVTPTADTSGAKLNKTDFTAGVGESVQLKVTGTDAAVSWSIGNSGIASVSASGVVKGVKAGTTTVYAKVGSTTLECIVRIK